MGAPAATAASAYWALAQMPRWATPPGATNALGDRNWAAAMMSAIFAVGVSMCRGSPPLSPHPAKSNVNAV
jgi:hypothetical protein